MPIGLPATVFAAFLQLCRRVHSPLGGLPPSGRHGVPLTLLQHEERALQGFGQWGRVSQPLRNSGQRRSRGHLRPAARSCPAHAALPSRPQTCASYSSDARACTAGRTACRRQRGGRAARRQACQHSSGQQERRPRRPAQQQRKRAAQPWPPSLACTRSCTSALTPLPRCCP